MKSTITSPTLLGLLLLALPQLSTAQTFKILKSFDTNSTTGFNSVSRLIQGPGGYLYGTASRGGAYHSGSIYRIQTNGSDFASIHSFTGNGGGSTPWTGLTLAGGVLYGMTSDYYGSAGHYGTIFKLNPDGSGFTNFYSFTGGNDGSQPVSDALVLGGSTLYGTASFGGSAGYGTVYGIDTNGGNFTVVYTFTNGVDGGNPYGGVILSGDTLYGITSGGGSLGGNGTNGTIFAVNTNGSGFTVLHTFSGGDGSRAYAGLIQSGNTLYGANFYGGPTDYGTVFRVNIDGSGFSVLHYFSGNGTFGVEPECTLQMSGSLLYGTSVYGGQFGTGTLFRVGADGSGFTTLRSFNGTTDGAKPSAGLLMLGNTFYGTTFASGGTGCEGTVFSFNAAIPLRATANDGNLILTWNDPAFLLQSASAPGGPYQTIAAASSPYTASGTNGQQFFRLQSQ